MLVCEALSHERLAQIPDSRGYTTVKQDWRYVLQLDSLMLYTNVRVV